MAPLGVLLAECAAALAALQVDQPRLEARLLIGHALGLERERLLALAPDTPVPAEAARALLRRRAEERVPLSYLTGRRGFWTLELDVSPATLIPRPDTETVVSLALETVGFDRDAPRILDLGTGTGAILLALLAERPLGTGIGVDRSFAACAVARANAERHGLGGRAGIVCADWTAALAPARHFDLVVSNPPYVRRDAIPGLAPEIARHEPRAALDGGVDGLDAYRALLPQVPGLLADGGVLVVEIGAGQVGDVVSLAAAQQLGLRATREDLGGVPRALAFAVE